MTRTYVITGSASGIGKSTKDLLMSRGHRVIGIDLADAEIEIDLSDARQRATIYDRVAEASNGSVNAVIAVAGVAAPVSRGVSVNYYGARDTLVTLRPLLAESTAPRAVVVTSISVIHPANDELKDALLNSDESRALALADQLVESGQGGFIYTSAKRAIAEWVRINAITEEWAGAGIPLNSMGPGTVVTPMTTPHLSNPDGLAMMRKTTPMPLSGPAQPEDAARLLAWLASEENSHITGQTIFMDGGCEAVLRGPRVFDGVTYADLM